MKTASAVVQAHVTRWMEEMLCPACDGWNGHNKGCQRHLLQEAERAERELAGASGEGWRRNMSQVEVIREAVQPRRGGRI
jgi:hypothetical protein